MAAEGGIEIINGLQLIRIPEPLTLCVVPALKIFTGHRRMIFIRSVNSRITSLPSPFVLAVNLDSYHLSRYN
jgi:hypothetical protein